MTSVPNPPGLPHPCLWVMSPRPRRALWEKVDAAVVRAHPKRPRQLRSGSDLLMETETTEYVGYGQPLMLPVRWGGRKHEVHYATWAAQDGTHDPRLLSIWGTFWG